MQRLLMRACGITLLALAVSACQYLPKMPWQKQTTADAAKVEHNAEVDHLVAQGDLAFTKDRLNLPANDNAVLYYRKALELAPGDKAATAGLEKVKKRYLELARVAHGNGRDGLAASYLKRAAELGGDDEEISKVRATLKETPKGQNKRAMQVKGVRDYRLATEDLDKRNAKIRDQLHAAALLAQQTDRSIAITARSQDEGDWIARTLREAVPKYDLHTSVAIGEYPALLLRAEE